MLEWIEETEKLFPDCLGFGRLVGLDYQYWHPVNPTEGMKGRELLERAAETLNVSRMYGLPIEQVKLSCPGRNLYVVSRNKSAVCVVLPSREIEDEANVWEGLAKVHDLAPLDDA